MKRTPLKRGRPRRRSAVERDGSRAWKVMVGAVCEVCPREGGICEGPNQGHHVVSQSKLKRIGRHDLLWDQRNKLDVCERRHRQHTDGVRAIPYTALSPDAHAFAAELELEWWIERFYAST